MIIYLHAKYNRVIQSKELIIIEFKHISLNYKYYFWWEIIRHRSGNLPILSIHHGAPSILYCHYWRPRSKKWHNRFYEQRSNKNKFRYTFPCFLSQIVDVLESFSLDGVVSPLCDDPGELGECAGVQFDPVDFLLRVRAPRSSVHIILVSWCLKEMCWLLTDTVTRFLLCSGE